MERKGFWWSSGAVRILRERYRTDGPGKLAKELGTTNASVVAKARRLGIEPSRRNAPPVEWTEEMDAIMRQLFPTADRQTLTKALGVPYHACQHRARKLGLWNVTGRERASRSKAEHCTSCDIHFFDQWTDDSAYALGFAFADGNVTKRLYELVIGIKSTDEEVLLWIKERTKCRRAIRREAAYTDVDGYNHSESSFLTLSGAILVRRLLELGLHPRKTYRDDPFPDVPKEFLPHFVRGYFDGDGSVFVSGSGTCTVKLIGTLQMVAGLRQALVFHAGMFASKAFVEHGKEAEWCRTTWSAKGDLRKFYDYIYPAGFAFCLERKRKVLEDWLVQPHLDDGPRRWTENELNEMNSLYRTLGPDGMAKRLDRTVTSVFTKAKELGLR